MKLCVKDRVDFISQFVSLIYSFDCLVLGPVSVTGVPK